MLRERDENGVLMSCQCNQEEEGEEGKKKERRE